MITIRAKATIYSKSGIAYHSILIFNLDKATGKITYVRYKCKISLRPYMILHLLADVYTKLGVSVPTPDTVHYENNNGSHGIHPALQISSGTRYRLDQQIHEKWILNPNVPQLVNYFIEFNNKQKEELIYSLAKCGTHPYNVLSKNSSPNWTWNILK